MHIWQRNLFIKILMAFFLSLVLNRCGLISVKPPSPPLNQQRVNELLNNVDKQESLVDTVFYTGRIAVKRTGLDADASLLVIGIKKPLKIRIETTHSWGRPLFHIVINGSKIHILSFTEKRHYLGQIGTPGAWKFLPGLNLDQVWTIARAYPILRKHDQAISQKGEQITLTNEKGEALQVIEFYADTFLPSMAFNPAQDIKVSFSNHKNRNGIIYAERIGLDDLEAGTRIQIDIREISFNRVIPKEIFNLEPPADFVVLPLEKALQE